MTFLIICFDDNSYLYIYFSVLFPPRPKVGFKKIYRCSFEPGVIFENQKLREIFVSEATDSCKGSKWGFFGVPSTTISRWLTRVFHVSTRVPLISSKMKLQRHVRSQNSGSWGCQTQLDHSHMSTTCILRVYTCPP